MINRFSILLILICLFVITGCQVFGPDYKDQVIAVITTYDEIFKKMDILTKKLETNPELVKDQSWIGEAKSLVSAVKSNGDALRKISPPEKYKSAHDELLKAADFFDTGTTLMVEGATEINLDKVQQGRADLDKATQFLVNGATILDAQ